MNENDAQDLASRTDLRLEIDYFIDALASLRARSYDAPLVDLKGDADELGYRLGSLTFADHLD